MNSPPFFVITGGPGSGKTTLLAELSRRGHLCVPEDARALIREQVASGGDALPWANRSRYAEILLRRSIATWQATEQAHATSGSQRSVYFDRGVGDALTCAEQIGYTVPVALMQQAHACRYRNPVFLAPWWLEIYATDAERRQTQAEAERTQSECVRTYTSLGYTVLPLPLASPAARADFVLHSS